MLDDDIGLNSSRVVVTKAGLKAQTSSRGCPLYNQAPERSIRMVKPADNHFSSFFETLFKSLPGKFLVVNAIDFTIAAVSDEFLTATSTRRSDILQRSIIDVLPNDLADQNVNGAHGLSDSLRRVRSNGQADVMAIRRFCVPRPPGSGDGYEEKYWSCVNIPLGQPDGSVAFIMHRIEDVTCIMQGNPEQRDVLLSEIQDRERQRQVNILLCSQQARSDNLQEEAANLQVAQRLLGLGIWKLNLDTTQLVFSDDALRLLGLPGDVKPEDLTSLLRLLHPDDRRVLTSALDALNTSDHRSFQLDLRFIRSNKQLNHVRVAGELSEPEDGRVVTGILQDINKQVQTEASLAKTYGQLLIAGKAVHLGGWEVNLDTGSVYWSEETCHIHEVPAGYTPTLEEALNFYAPEHRAQIEEAFNRCATQGIAFDERLQIITAKGHLMWVRAIGEAIRNDRGAITSVQGAFQDISELVAAREESQQLSRRLLDTLESISDAFIIIDHEWRFGFLNNRAESLLHRKREELLNKHLWTEFPLAVGTRFQQQYELAVAEQKTVRFIEFYPEPLNTWFEVSAYPTSDGIAVYFRDVNERIAQERALRINEERFRLIAKATNDVIWDWDRTHNTIWWSENLFHVFGHDPGDNASGSRVWVERIHPEDRDQVLHGISAAVGSKASSWQSEYRFLHANGQTRWVSDRGFIIRNQQGKAIRMIGSMADVTDAHEMSERLRQSQKLEAVGQLTGGVAHDFNNLLTVILGNAELLSEQLTDQQQLRMLAEMTATAAERGAELTSRLLAFARRQPLEPKLLNLNKLIRGMDGLLRRTLQEDIDIETVFAGGLWLCEVDPGQLEGALLNLAINARDAMPGGGKLTIETANTRLDDSYASSHDEVEAGQYVLVSVSDTGEGMPAEVVTRAFEPFFTTKKIGKGSGLGLSMVYGFVKQSGGHVKIYSEKNEGTTVKLYLPRATSTENPVIYEGPLALKVRGGTEKILLVEDDSLVREHVDSLLKGLGYQVISTSNADEAKDVLMQLNDVDLLFTDIVMPGSMNGRELAEVARQLRPGIRVLFTSGYTENAIVHHGRLDQGVELLNKPYRRQELAAKVRKVLDDPV